MPRRTNRFTSVRTQSLWYYGQSLPWLPRAGEGGRHPGPSSGHLLRSAVAGLLLFLHTSAPRSAAFGASRVVVRLRSLLPRLLETPQRSRDALARTSPESAPECQVVAGWAAGLARTNPSSTSSLLRLFLSRPQGGGGGRGRRPRSEGELMFGASDALRGRTLQVSFATSRTRSVMPKPAMAAKTIQPKALPVAPQ